MSPSPVVAMCFVLAVACSSGDAAPPETLTSPAATAPGPAVTATAPDATRARIEQLDRAFTTQWGPTKYNNAGWPDGYDDCGPTSLVMVDAVRGTSPAPLDPSNALSRIRAMRDLAHGEHTPRSAPTYGPRMLTALHALGYSAADMNLAGDATSEASVTRVIARLRSGDTVLLAGDPGSAWGRALWAKRAYLHPYDVTVARDHFGHWVVVFESTDNDTFLVGDPLSSGGVIAVTAAQLVRYVKDGASRRGAIWVH